MEAFILRLSLIAVSFEVDFLVCRISDIAMLGREFLSQKDCSVTCDKGLLSMESKTIECTERVHRMLANKFQVTRTMVQPPDREVHISCRLNSNLNRPTRLIKSLVVKPSMSWLPPL